MSDVIQSSSMQVKPLIDQYGRVAKDLRVSLTDRCNLRCQYCMPAEGMVWMPREGILTDDEVIRLIRIGVEQLGITKIRFTGGEPTLRKNLVEIIRATSRMKSVEPLTIGLTTNGLSLDKHVNSLVDAGLTRVNISLDSLDPAHYTAITRRERVLAAVKGIQSAAVTEGLEVKVNAVLQPVWFREDIPQLLKFCLTQQIELRFIEQLPIGPRHAWRLDEVVTRQDVLDCLTDAGFVLSADPRERGSAPAERFQVAPGKDHLGGTVGIIASVTASFCDSCTRTRLTADGMIRSCLFGIHETNLRDLMRTGATDEQLVQVWRKATWVKPKAHGISTGEDLTGFATPTRTMSAIGG